MNTRILIAGLSLAAFTSFGCTAKDDENPATGAADDVADDAMDDAMDDGVGSGTAGADDAPMDSTAGDDGMAESSGGADSGGQTFLIQPDGANGGIFECDLWAQDCPDGEKCMPWASDGGTWNATRCTEINDSPAQPGDTCLVEGNGATGIDSCDIGGMCWDVDPETNEGTCVAMCTGNADNPLCEDPDTTCSIANGGSLILCLPVCQPLLQDCPDGNACYPINDSFACAPDVSGEMGVYGDPCEFINVCDPGLACLDPAAVGEPNCAAAGGCCGSFCDLSAPANTCPGMALGQVCTSPYAEGAVPPGYEDTGWCVIPA